MEDRQKILIVDDKKENLYLLEKILSETGAEIIKASSGNAALKATLSHEFALAILDVQMPGMDGYELAEFIRAEEKTRHVPIIFMSAVYSDDYYVFKGYDAGAVDYIVRPYNPKILLSKVDVFLQLENNLRELQASEGRFRSLVMTIPDIIYMIDTAGKFIFLNDAVQKLCYEPEKLIGKHFGEIILPPDVEVVSRSIVLPKYKGKVTVDKNAPKLFDERRTGKRKTTGLEIRLAMKGGKEFKPGLIKPLGKEVIVVEVNSSGMYEINPNTKEKIFIGTVGVVRDISERKRSEKALHDVQEELVRKEKLALLGQLAGGVAHELRNPLGVISNAIYYLRTVLSDADETIKEYLDIITSEVGNSEKIVSDLLGFSRSRQAEREKIAVSELVAQALEKQPPPEGVKVRTDIAPYLPPVIIDPRQIGQVLFNLISNAYQAMTSLSSPPQAGGGGRGGRLTISAELLEGGTARNPKSEIRIRISDTGPGISKENMKKIFEPLFTTRARGIGLGLAVSKNLVEVNGGSIEVESREGKGSIFTVSLPVKIED